MQFTCQKSDLTNALRIVIKGIATKPQTPILSGIYIQANPDGWIELQSTNYELGFKYHFEAEVSEAGQIVVAGRYFQEVVAKLPGKSLSVEYSASENIVHIQSEQANFTLLSMNASDFPKLKPIEGNVKFQIKDTILADLIKKTVFCCSTDDSHPIFTGCLLQVNASKITMAATNARCLAVKSCSDSEEIGQIEIIIPAKILNEIKSLPIGKVPTDVTVISSYNQISFEVDNLYMTSRLIEGRFPDYTKVIPQGFATKVRLNTANLAAAVDRVSLISRSENYNVVRLTFADNKLHLASNNPEIGEAQEDIEAEIEGPDIQIGFNAQYLSDALKVIDTESCEFLLNHSLKPGCIREEGRDDFTYVITPIRIRS